jgi:transposase InsO family protein
VKFLQKKSNASQALQDFIRELKRQDHKVENIRTDHGGEYINKELDEFFRSTGIIHKLSPPYSYESNGVVECYNRTIVTRYEK